MKCGWPRRGDEIENYRQYSYILVNDVLDQAVEDLAAIILSERARRKGLPLDAEGVRIFEMAEQCRQSKATDRLRPVLSSFGLLDPAHA